MSIDEKSIVQLLREDKQSIADLIEVIGFDNVLDAIANVIEKEYVGKDKGMQMTKCIHGNVCRAYMKNGARILSDLCPKHCVYFKSAKVCKKCGAEVDNTHAIYCSKCGKKL